MNNASSIASGSRHTEHEIFNSDKVTPLSECRLIIKDWPIWVHLSLNDIRTKYRRAALGPWWLVLGMGISMALMAVTWSIIFKLDWRHYLPYMITGIICWHWISAYVTQSCDIFAHDFAPLLRSLPASPLIHTTRFVMRGFWMFLHYLPVWFVTALVTGVWPNLTSLLFLPIGIACVLITALSVSLVLGMAGARFRDLSPAVGALMTPMMLLTPVMWTPDMLGQYSLIAWINPFSHYIAVIRAPILGEMPSLMGMGIVGALTLLSAGIAAFCYHRYRAFLVLWV